jgi:hypothetical protein
VAKKKVTTATATASMLSTEAVPMVGPALELEVPTVTVASIPGQKVGEE